MDLRKGKGLKKVMEKAKADFKKFTLTEEDYYAVEIAMNVARGFLKLPDITPEQIIGIGYALHALEQLPMVTEGTNCEFGLEYQAGSEEDKEYIMFGISETYLDITIGISDYNNALVSDTPNQPRWRVEIGGTRNTKCDLSELEDSIEEYLNLGAELVVNKKGNIHI